MPLIDRRRFHLLLATTAASLSMSAVGWAQAPGARVRRSINDAEHGPELTRQYRKAVSLLRSLDESDPRHWNNLAKIHTDHCPHGNWYFLPWHRAYLSAIEQVCAGVLGDPGFALPYWDWSVHRQLPPGFVDPADGAAPNALYHDARDMKENDTLSTMLSPFGMDAEQIFGAAAMKTILGQRTFQQFGSLKPSGQDDISPRWQRGRGSKTLLEREPHDFLHGAVGGDMGDPRTSPLDPIFYLHHANIDRLWSLWGTTTGITEPDPLWGGFRFSGNFPNPDGSPAADIQVADLIAVRNLGYVYDTDPGAIMTSVRPASDFEILRSQQWGALIGTGVVGELALQAAGVPGPVLEPTGSGDRQVYLLLDEVSAPKSRATNVRVFLNCDYLTPMTPLDDPHFVGNFTFFVPGGEEHEGHEGHGSTQSFAIDLTPTLQRLRESGQPVDDTILPQFLALSFSGKEVGESQFTIGRVEIATQ